MKKLLAASFVFAVLISAGSFAASMAEDQDPSFPDVPTNHENAQAIAWLKLTGVVQGYSDGTFKPDNKINRAEFLKMLYETIGMEGHNPELSFPDVPADAWYTKYVKEAFYTKVAVGYPDGHFRPENNINFVEAVKVVMNGFFNVDDLYGDGADYSPCDEDLTDYDDIDTSAWYWKYLHVADEMCITDFGHSAVGVWGFDPGAFITRADMAEMLYRSHLEQANLETDESGGEDGMMDDEEAEDDSITDDAPFSLASSEFDNNGVIDAVNTCDGSDMSPELSIAGVPDNAITLALILDDPDAPSGTWIHWVVWNIPPDTVIINGDGGMQPPLSNEAIVGTNSFGNAHYGGPCPPLEDGAHHYNFVLYALDTTLNLDASATKGDLVMAMDGHIIDTAELTGLYDSN